MTALAVGLLWLAVVVCLLLRVIRQGKVHFDGAVDPAVAPEHRPAMAIIVPARNEAVRIERCLRSLADQMRLADGSEILVVDDDSIDDTAARVSRLAATNTGIRLVRAGPLPPGWMGKPHACWRGALEAKADWLCFVDADVEAAPQLVSAAVAAAQHGNIDLLSLSPFQELGSFWERLIVPAGLLLIACVIDLRRINDPNAAEVTANGQFLLCRRDVYLAIGGHAAVRSEICEDKALAALTKQAGYRFRLLNAETLARTRMYADLASLWEGFSKNAVEVLGSPTATLGAAAGGLVFGWLAVALPIWSGWVLWHQPSAASSAGFAAALAGSLIILGMQIGTARHCRVPAAFGFAFPLAYTAVAALSWSSLAWRRAGRVRWKGRIYALPQKGDPGAR
jgi:chlorobactene glucosyltransferase